MGISERLFFELSLALSLSGVIALGFVLPNVLKSSRRVFSSLFALTTGAVVAATLNVVPVHILSQGTVLNLSQYYNIQVRDRHEHHYLPVSLSLKCISP